MIFFVNFWLFWYNCLVVVGNFWILFKFEIVFNIKLLVVFDKVWRFCELLLEGVELDVLLSIVFIFFIFEEIFVVIVLVEVGVLVIVEVIWDCCLGVKFLKVDVDCIVVICFCLLVVVVFIKVFVFDLIVDKKLNNLLLVLLLVVVVDCKFVIIWFRFFNLFERFCKVCFCFGFSWVVCDNCCKLFVNFFDFFINVWDLLFNFWLFLFNLCIFVV